MAELWAYLNFLLVLSVGLRYYCYLSCPTPTLLYFHQQPLAQLRGTKGYLATVTFLVQTRDWN